MLYQLDIYNGSKLKNCFIGLGFEISETMKSCVKKSKLYSNCIAHIKVLDDLNDNVYRENIPFNEWNAVANELENN